VTHSRLAVKGNAESLPFEETKTIMPSVPAGSDRFTRPAPGDAQIESLRLPPHSVEAEQAVLGGLLLSNVAWDRVGDVIGEPDFYRADHRLLWRVITKLIEDNKPADVLTVTEALKTSGEMNDVGGLAYLHQLASGTPSAANIRRYAEIVRERAIMRRLAEVGTSIADSAYSPQGREARQLLDGGAGRLPVGREVGRRTRHLLPAGQHRDQRLLAHGHEGVAGDEDAVLIAEEGDVAGRVARRVEPPPAFHPGEAPVLVQQAETVPEVDGAAGKEARGHPCHGAAAHGGIGRRIVGAAREVRRLQPVGVDGDVPALRQTPHRAGVIEVAMGQDDGRGPRARAEAPLRLADDGTTRGRHAGIDQHPAPVPRPALADEADVDDGKLEARDVRCHLEDPCGSDCRSLKSLDCHAVFPLVEVPGSGGPADAVRRMLQWRCRVRFTGEPLPFGAAGQS